MKRFWRIGLVCCLVCLLAVLFAGCGAKTLDPLSYVTVTAEGHDGFGTVTVTVDTDKLNQSVNSKKLSEYTAGLSAAYQGAAFADLLDITWDGVENGSAANKDVVTVRLNLVEELRAGGYTLNGLADALGIEFETLTKSVTIAELASVRRLDFTPALVNCVKFSGGDGGGTASLTGHFTYDSKTGDIVFTWNGDKEKYTGHVVATENGEVIGSWPVVVTPDAGLSEGQTVEVGLTGDLLALLERGYVIDDSTIEVTVSGLGRYLTSPTELTAVIKGDIDARVTAFVNEHPDRYPDGEYKIIDRQFYSRMESEGVPARECRLIGVQIESGRAFSDQATTQPEGEVTMPLDGELPVLSVNRDVLLYAVMASDDGFEVSLVENRSQHEDIGAETDVQWFADDEFLALYKTSDLSW